MFYLRSRSAFEPWAKELIDNEFFPIRANMLIACWSALEVAVEDTIVLLAARWPQTMDTARANGVNLDKYLVRGINESSARRAAVAVERFARTERLAGPAMTEALRIVGINVNCAPECLDVLTEMNAVRNCILHRGGILDARGATEAPALGLAEGEMISIDTERMQEYLKSVSDFAVALIGGCSHLFPETVAAAKAVETSA